MSRFNRVGIGAQGATSPVATVPDRTTHTYNGAPGFVRTKRSELFLLATSNMGGDDTFYEKGSDRDSRYRTLIHDLAVNDSEWLAEMLKWLRGPESNMRSASIIGAAEFLYARQKAGLHGQSRQVIDSVLQRADEPGEILAYWMSRYGRPNGRGRKEDGSMPTAPVLPMALIRGVRDAVGRLYNEKSLIKWDKEGAAVRFGDVIELVHPAGETPARNALYSHAIDRRHKHDDEVSDLLEVVRKNRWIKSLSAKEIERLANEGSLADFVKGAGMTWEQLAGLGPMTATKWQAMIPLMGVMALIRNLRNFDEAGVSDEVAELVLAKLKDPNEIAASRQFPYRFLSAADNAPSLRWGHALDIALGHSLRNIPALPGRSLILIDTSGSMTSGMSDRSQMSRLKAAAVFGVALGVRNAGNADIFGFADGEFRHGVKLGASAMTEIQRFVRRAGEVGHGTDLAGAVQRRFNSSIHDRIFLFSDMQTTTGNILWGVPPDVPFYGFNLGGYHAGATELGPNRHEFTTVGDSAFKLIPSLEQGENGTWPWLVED